MGQFKFERVNTHRTFADLVEHYISDGALEHLRAQKDAIRHMNYWKERLSRLCACPSHPRASFQRTSAFN